MPKNERQFQSYFMKIAKPMNYYRTSLTTGSGFPDVVGFHGERHSLVELKDLELGHKGNKKLKQCFELSQPSWFLNYLKLGGTRLFVAMRVRHELSKWYGLWRVTPTMAMMLAKNELYYSDLESCPYYQTFDNCKKMIEGIESVS